MERILSRQSFDWFDKSKGEMELFTSYFNDRAKLERKMQSEWTALSTKWRGKFKDSLKESKTLSTSVEPTGQIIMLLLNEINDNVSICGRAVSVLDNERTSPSAILKRWLADPYKNTSCLNKDLFKAKYTDALEDLIEFRVDVEESKIMLQQIFEAYHIPNGNRWEQKLAFVREKYQEAVAEHKKKEASFIKEMAVLRDGLDSFEKNRLSTLKKAINIYESAVSEQGKEREFRRKRLETMKEYTSNTDDGFSVEDSAKKWLNSLNQRFYLRDYPIDPFREEDVIQHEPDEADCVGRVESEIKASKEDKDRTNCEIIASKEGKDRTECEIIASKEDKDRTECEIIASKEDKDRTECEIIASKEDKDRTECEIIESKEDKDRTECEVIASKEDKDRTECEIIASKEDKDRTECEIIASKEDKDRTECEIIASKEDKDRTECEIIASKEDKDRTECEIIASKEDKDRTECEIIASKEECEIIASKEDKDRTESEKTASRADKGNNSKKNKIKNFFKKNKRKH